MFNLNSIAPLDSAVEAKILFENGQALVLPAGAKLQIKLNFFEECYSFEDLIEFLYYLYCQGVENDILKSEKDSLEDFLRKIIGNILEYHKYFWQDELVNINSWFYEKEEHFLGPHRVSIIPRKDNTI
jgi:hypothetical protein